MTDMTMGLLGSVFCLIMFCPGDITGCGSDWSAFDDYCYKIVTSDSSSFADVLQARVACRKDGTDLGTIRSEQEQNFTVGLLRDSSADEVYIALSDTMKENDFVFYDGTRPTFTNWGADEPNNYPSFGGENCVSVIHIDKYKNLGDWVDVPCLFNPRQISGAFCKKLKSEPLQDISDRFFHDKYHMIKGSYMMHSALSSINVPSYADCVRHCSQTAACFSVNYNRDRSTAYNCILNSQSRMVSRNLTSDSSVAGFQLDEWIYYEQCFKGQ